MQIIVTGRHVDLTDAIEQYAIKRCAHLEKYREHLQSIEIVLDKAKIEYDVEVKIDVPHHSIFVGRAGHEDLYAGIDQAIDKVERQLHDWKEKLQRHK